MARELGLAEILDSVQSDSVKERENGLADLRHALDHHRKADSLQSIKDKLIHRLFETLFQVTSRERDTFARAAKPTIRATSESRLTSCASTLRFTTATLVHRIRLKTLRAFLGHVVQVLPDTEEGLCKPLSDDYIKSLMLLLEHQPHAEHLLQEDWCNIVDFCLEAILSLDDGIAESASAGDSLFASRTTEILSQRPSDRPANSQRSNDRAPKARNNLYGMLHCLKHLTVIPSAPINLRASRICDCILNFLDSCSSITTAHVAALTALNAVLTRISLSDALLMSSLISRLLQLVRRLWRFRESLLRDQLLHTLIIILPHIEHLQYSADSEDIYSHVETLLVEVRNDYIQNEQRDRKRIALDDLCLSSLKILPEESKVFTRKTFALRYSLMSAEHSWTVLSVLGFLTSWLDRRTISSREQHDQTSQDQLARKRQKLMPLRVKELFDSLEPGLSSERVQLLHMALFAASNRVLSDEEMQDYVQATVALLEDHDKAISSWAYLILAELSAQSSSRSAFLLPAWDRTAKVACTHINTASHCRASCHFLKCLLENECIKIEGISAFLHNMLSATNLHGPSIVCDSSIAYWITVSAKLSRAQTMSDLCHRGFLDWLLTRWQPSNFENRAYSQQLSTSTSCLDLKCAFSYACRQQPPEFDKCCFFVLGDLGRAWRLQSIQRPLCEYLFLLDASDSLRSYRSQKAISHPAPAPTATVQSPKDTIRILSFLVAEAMKIKDSLAADPNSVAPNLTPDMLQVLVSFHIASTWTCFQLRPKKTMLLIELSGHLSRIADSICDYVSRSQTPQSVVDDLLLVVSLNLPSIFSAVSHFSIWGNSYAKPKFIYQLITAIRKRQSRVEAIQEEDSGQFDDLDSFQDSQMPRSRRRELRKQERDDLGNLTSKNSATNSIEGYLYLILYAEERQIDDDPAVMPVDFMKHLTSLSASTFLSNKPLIQQLVNSEFRFSSTQALSLLDYVKESYLSNYDYERGEVAIDLCLQLMKGFTHFWSRKNSSALVEDCADLYKWFVDNSAACPARVQATFSDLLSILLETSPDYGKESLRPSVRTTLLRVLKQSELSVQYHIAQDIPKIFGKHVLSQHERIFDDVHEALPRDESQASGIALRLSILARLGSAWKTLLRRCVYHIFETAGLVPSAVGHAKRCIEQITAAYNLASSKDLLRLFQGQLLFTWLDKDHANQSLDSIPFAIFGFPDQKSFLSYVQPEVVSQAAMQDSEQQMSRIAEIFGCTFADLIPSSFGQVMAYVLAKDASSKVAEQSRRLEIRVRDLLGQSRYASLLQKELPAIMGHLIDHLHGEDQMVKYLAKREDLEAAGTRLSDIKSTGWISTELAPAQQPSFKSRWFPDVLSRLARRLHKDANDLWTPQNTVVVCRLLLNSISDALGPLHARRVLARLAIVVSLAPDATSRDYPLQQLVHGIRPFVTDPQCAPDAACLMQYLLFSGQGSLRKSPQFNLGINLMLQFTLKSFVERPQDPTIQESEYTATTQRISTFQKWLDEFGQRLLPDITPECPESFCRTCSQVLSVAKAASYKANAIQDSYESMLLKFLLSDIRTSRPSLTGPYRKRCFEVFVADFTAPETVENDIFGSDASAERYMSHLWQSCKHFTVPQPYLGWAAKALGRGFAYKGQMSSSLSSESNIKQNATLSKGPIPEASSETAILRCVADCLEMQEALEIGAAERTLRRLYSALRGTEKETLLNEVLSISMMSSFSPSTFSADFDESPSSPKDPDLRAILANIETDACDVWLQNITVKICRSVRENKILHSLVPAVTTIPTLATQILPFVLHLALLEGIKISESNIRDQIGDGIVQLFENASSQTTEHCRAVVDCILYLHTQPFPGEQTMGERSKWLENLSYELVAKSAIKCQMFKAATLLLEKSDAKQTGSVADAREQGSSTNEMLLSIFQQIDEPDSYYGIQQTASLPALASRLDFEGNAVESLTLHGAEMDSQVRSGQNTSPAFSKLLLSLSQMNLNGLTEGIVSRTDIAESSNDMLDTNIIKSAMKLQKWDVPSRKAIASSTGILYKTLQNMSGYKSMTEAQSTINDGLLEALNLTVSHSSPLTEPLRHSFAALSALTETNDLISCQSMKQMEEMHRKLRTRESWMAQSSLEDVSLLLSSRESLFSIVAKYNPDDLSPEKKKANWSNIVEANLHSSKIYRLVGTPQNSLLNVTYLSNVQEECFRAGVPISSKVQFETARVLWDRGEQVLSIKMLQELSSRPDTSWRLAELGRAGLLALLAHCVSEARLENPDDIMSKYLTEALRELGSKKIGREAGKVFHEFATYCHNQLTSPDFVAEFDRSEKFRRGKRKELQDLDNLDKGKMSDQEKHKLRSDKSKVKKWLMIDDQDYKRRRETRNQLLQQSLENYLMSLSASDEQDNDILRFFALWLEHSAEDAANEAVQERIRQVPSRKFIHLMNQLASRLQDSGDTFQNTMAELVGRICAEHPYHGMNHIFAGSRTEGGNDTTAQSRHAAAVKIAQRLQSNAETSRVWSAISRSNELFIKAASTKTEDMKQGAKLRLRNFNATKTLEKEIPELKVPPITMQISIRDDLDYSGVAVISSFQPWMAIAGGISTPKILTVVSSAGVKYVQLYKAGSDDLRQDAIMEQVFEQVSGLLKTSKKTRQRKLGIRTYKVVPLNANAGAIEFVSNTTSFNDYLNDAHMRYHPSDLKWNAARRKIDGAKELKPAGRVQAYKEVAAKFSPVLRHFFFENFEDPDDWFATRLAYTRSTAAISILGYILGLGDRHCQNILLDKTSGEVVHIDLGVAFEAGRILNIPEVVPFRLTRDVVDGFGITKTEGVFRRCCEFTLEALRRNKDAIMTILNVLRYDPLYSWSVSPLRAKKLQEEQEKDLAAAQETGVSFAPGTSMANRTRASTRASLGQEETRANEEQRRKKGGDDGEGGEADRALSVVERKLAAGLSVEATVNELIQQASDEKNLAVLFCGWAAFA